MIPLKNIPNWNSPTLYTHINQNSLTLLTGIYIPISYTNLSITLIGAGGQGQWSIDNGISWQNSGDTLWVETNINYPISYKIVANWHKPTLPNAVYFYENQPQYFTVSYTPVTQGYVTVEIEGGNGQGQWSIDFGTTWHDSGDSILLAANPYPYPIQFREIANWIKPNIMYVATNNIIHQHFTGVYRPFTPFSMILEGADGQGQWSPNGVHWYNSNDTILLRGDRYHSFSYKNVSNWEKPNYPTGTYLVHSQAQTLTAAYRLIVATALLGWQIYTPIQ